MQKLKLPLTGALHHLPPLCTTEGTVLSWLQHTWEPSLAPIAGLTVSSAVSADLSPSTTKDISGG